MGRIIKNRTLIFLVVFSFNLQVSQAGDMSIPNVFVNGTVSSAEEVNDNFNAAKTAIDDNYSQITTNTSLSQDNQLNINDLTSRVSALEVKETVTMVLKSNTKDVGYLISANINSYTTVSSNGYVLTANRTDGTITNHPQPLFTTTDCSGSSYIYATNISPSTVFKSIVPNSGIDQALYYSPKSDIPITRDVQSQYVFTTFDPVSGEPTGAACQTFPITNSPTVNYVIYDEVITGYSSLLFDTDYNLDLPLVIEVNK